MKKTIISILPHLQGGGVERVVSLLSEGLSLRGFDVHIITVKPYSSNFPISDSITVHNLDLTARNMFNLRMSDWKKSRLLDDYIKKNITQSPDLILCHQDTITRSMKHSKLENIHHVIHSHLSNSKLLNKSTISNFLTKLHLTILYRNKSCISVSNGILDDAKINFSIDNIKCIYNAVDKESITNQSQDIRPCNTNYLVHIGNFTIAKRHDRLIDAYLKSGIKTPLYLIGSESELTESIRIKIAEHKAEMSIIIHGFDNNPYPWIANAKGLILSSDFEGLPMVLIEAVALGTPIISTNCKSGPSEVVGIHTKCLSELNVEHLAKKISQLDKTPQKFQIPLLEQFTAEYMIDEYISLM